MTLISRSLAPVARHGLAEAVTALLLDPRRPGRGDLLAPVPSAVPSTEAPRAARPFAATGPTGLGTSAARPWARGGPVARPRGRAEEPAERPGGQQSRREADKGPVRPVLYCPPAVRDDPALGETVNDRLVAWAGETGIYPGRIDQVRAADFGRLIMLAHPETDDADRLLAAAKCALSEWAVDDHYLDGEAEEPHPELLGRRLALAHSVVDQAHLPVRHAPELERVVRRDPVMVALRSALANLATYATTTQVQRLRHELAIMFVAYNQEAVWATTGRTPPVWEFLTHRHENSFVPCMVLIDAVAGYELPQAEFADPRVRRVFTLAGSASVIVNDLYSMAKEDPADFSLPRLIAAEEGCSPHEAVDRTVELHDELMHTYEAEAAALALTGSPQLRRFLAGVWAWLGGSREWHAGTARYAATAA